ncbi:hypothetical protein ACWGK6_15535 [Streptomyces violaceusniger]
MDLEAVASLLAVPVALLTAWWAWRGANKGAEATVTAGRSQSEAAVEAVWRQGRNEHEQWIHNARSDAYSEFLRAADALARTVKRLPQVDYEHREELLAQRSMAVDEAYARVEVLGSPSVTAQAQHLRSHCHRLERTALRRAVLKSAVEALENESCWDNPEHCENQHHNSASVAWNLLVSWGRLEFEEQCEERGFLEFCLQGSGALSDEHIAQVLDVSKNTAGWDDLIGGWSRDPLDERFQDARIEFVNAMRHSTTAT